jgi:hypothetical protein
MPSLDMARSETGLAVDTLAGESLIALGRISQMWT